MRIACLLRSQLANLHQVVHQRVVVGLVQYLRGLGSPSGTDMIHARVADMSDGSTGTVQLEHSHRGAHLLLGMGILVVQGIICGCDGFLSDLCGEGLILTRALGKYRCRHRLAHRGTRYLARVVPTHTIAYQKQTVLCLGFAIGGEHRVLLMGITLIVLALTKFPYCVGRNCILHCLCIIKRAMLRSVYQRLVAPIMSEYYYLWSIHL